MIDFFFVCELINVVDDSILVMGFRVDVFLCWKKVMMVMFRRRVVKVRNEREINFMMREEEEEKNKKYV